MGYYEVIYGTEDGKKGLLEWMKSEVEKLCYTGSQSVSVYINSLAEADEIRKGNFPCVHIYPVSDSFEKVTERTFKHETTVKIIASTKGSRRKAFKQAIEWSGLIYDHFRKTFPDLEGVKHPFVEGDTVFSWEGYRNKKHRNLMMAHSAVELVYE
ncbi:MAG: hypothetical protein R6U61_04335, partial [Thermoplasmata archaeon]